jgi:hypothetical protein
MDVWSEIVARYSNPGTRVLDICSGCGGAPMACMKLNRFCHCVERDLKLRLAVLARLHAFLGHLSLDLNFRLQTGIAPAEARHNGIDSYAWQTALLSQRDIGNGVLEVPKSNIPFGWPANVPDFQEWCTTENLLVQHSAVFGVPSLYVTTAVRKGEFIQGGLCGVYRGNVPRGMGGVCTVAIRSAPGERPLYLQGGEFCAASYGRDPAHPHYAAIFAKPGPVGENTSLKLPPDYNSRIVEDEHCPFGSIFQIQIEVTRDLIGTPVAPVEVIVDQGWWCEQEEEEEVEVEEKEGTEHEHD